MGINTNVKKEVRITRIKVNKNNKGKKDSYKKSIRKSHPVKHWLRELKKKVHSYRTEKELRTSSKVNHILRPNCQEKKPWTFYRMKKNQKSKEYSLSDSTLDDKEISIPWYKKTDRNIKKEIKSFEHYTESTTVPKETLIRRTPSESKKQRTV